jgi:Papain-like cysteine protease AvrRpt2
MSVHNHLDVQYHQQDTDYYCGAACAQMVLAQIGAGLLDQDSLYADNNSHSVAEGGWYTAPDGLTWTLNDRDPGIHYFVDFALTSEALISRKLCWTIEHYEVAPVALVFGSAHWIVIRGYEASAAPTSSGDNSYSIVAFDVNNPWPPTPTPAPPPPHAVGDVCGSGGDRGVADEHIAYSTWQSDYMTGVSGGYWGGKFVAVCDPEPPPISAGVRRRVQRRLSGEKLITPQRAARNAVTGLKAYNLAKRENWKKALAHARPANPVLVQRLDYPDRFYYIVPMGKTARRTPILVSVDARYGDYREAVFLPTKNRSQLVASMESKELVAKVSDKKFELEEPLGRLLVRPEAFCLYPMLVWKPCRESLSPFWPFHMFTIGGYRVYVRIDGAIFTRLHDGQRGI